MLLGSTLIEVPFCGELGCAPTDAGKGAKLLPPDVTWFTCDCAGVPSAAHSTTGAAVRRKPKYGTKTKSPFRCRQLASQVAPWSITWADAEKCRERNTDSCDSSYPYADDGATR